MNITHKYRPIRLSQVVGHNTVIKAIKGLVYSGDINTTILFCGPHGLGKTTLAWLVALYANCQNLSEEGEVCGSCSSCKQIEKAIKSGTDAPSVVEKQVSERGIDAIRVLEQQAQYRSPHKFRFFIIEEAHNLTRQAFDAALRLFEKPQSQARFILCTTNPEKLPKTIASRSITFNLKPLDPKVLAKELLLKVAKKEGFEISNKVLLQIARTVNGHPRDGLNLLAQVIASGVTDENIDEILPTIIEGYDLADPYKLPKSFVNSILSGKYGKAIASASQTPNPDYFISQVVDIFEQILLLTISPKLINQSKTHLFSNVSVPAVNDRQKVVQYVKTYAKILQRCQEAQILIRQFVCNNNVVLETLAVDLVDIIKKDA